MENTTSRVNKLYHVHASVCIRVFVCMYVCILCECVCSCACLCAGFSGARNCIGGRIGFKGNTAGAPRGTGMCDRRVSGEERFSVPKPQRGLGKGV